MLRGDQCRKRVVARRGWPIAATYVENHRADTSPHGDFAAHSVRPKTVQFAFFQGSGGGKAERNIRPGGSRDRHDLDMVFLWIDAGLDQRALQAEIDARRRADAQPLHHIEISASWF